MRFGAWLLGASLAQPAGVAAAPDCDADALDQEAFAAADAGMLPDALHIWERAYDCDPRPEFLFAQAEALRRLDDCEHAIARFERFAEASTQPVDRDEGRRRADECRATVAAKRPLPAVVSPPAPRLIPSDPPAPAPAPPRWYADLAGGALVGVGVGGLAIGSGLLGAAVAKDRAAANTEEAFFAVQPRVRGLALGGIVSLAIGGTLAVAGAIRYGLVHRRAKTVAAAPGTFAVRF